MFSGDLQELSDEGEWCVPDQGKSLGGKRALCLQDQKELLVAGLKIMRGSVVKDEDRRGQMVECLVLRGWTLLRAMGSH